VGTPVVHFSDMHHQREHGAGECDVSRSIHPSRGFEVKTVSAFDAGKNSGQLVLWSGGSSSFTRRWLEIARVSGDG